MKKLLTLLVAVAMLLSAVSFAAAEAPVKLVWWLFCSAEAPLDWAEVEEKLNEISAQEIGVVCEFRWLDANQVSTAMQAGEYFDITFTCDWYNDFATNALTGMFLDITELVNEEAGEMVGTMLDNIWAGAYINDRLYAIPHMKDYAMEIFWILDADYFLGEKELEVDQFITFAGIEPYFEMFKADYPDDYPFKAARGGMTSWMNGMGDWISQEYLIGLDWNAQGTDEETTVMSALEIPAFVERLQLLHKWYEMGYINPDAAVLESLLRSNAGVVQSGQGWFGAETIWSNARQKASYISRFEGPFLSTSSLRGSMTALSATTAHAKEAMELINLMNTNDAYRTLARYGIEDKHYTVVEPGIVRKTDLGNANMMLNAYTQGSYVVGPIEASSFESVPADPGMWAKVWAGYKDALTSAALGFTFDIMPVESQCLAMAAVWRDYVYELQTGTSDPDEML
ncbi:MAG: ABC transporter substrate-binding protein, partial [Clostridia bacterium]|nr:ABC transporter substrate-binding protein [Clostridia bacterium]